MPLLAGTRLGPYEIVAPLGAGGMGEVYRARDTRLGREVAIKVLPEQIADSEQARQRFEREARSASGLSHPNICAVFDIGSHDGVFYLVMELLQGETLAQRLERGPLALDELLDIAIPLADALDRAHSNGLMHRDLKPGNVMLTPGGVKLLDFGLAKGVEASRPANLTATPTMTSPLTTAGMIVGTFQYMSPEQIEGREADVRSDLWAFGAVLYEMATGRKAFGGATQASLIASILRDDLRSTPDGRPLRPPAFERLVLRCLEKDPDQRWQTARDLGAELRWIRSGDAPQEQAGAGTGDGGARMPRRVWAALPLLVLASVAAGWALHRPPNVVKPVVRSEIRLPAGTRMDTDNRSMALSPDGTVLAYAGIGGDGVSGIWLRRLDSLVPQHLAGTEGASYPFWSPDGRSLGFFADGKLRKIPAGGGTAVTLCEAINGRGASWGAADVIVFAPAPFGVLMRVAASGGTPVPVTVDERENFSHRNPHFLPDGRRLLYYLGAGTGDDETDGIYSLDLRSGETSRVLAVRSEAMYVDPGYLAYVRDQNLVVQPFDLDTLEVSGEPIPVGEDVQFSSFRFTGTFAFAGPERLIYRRGSVANDGQLTWFDLEGNELGTLGDPQQFWTTVAISPDGKRAVADVRARDGRADLWMYDLERSLGNRFTFGDEAALLPAWSPDGREISFSNGGGGVFIKSADGLSPARPVALESNSFPASWTADGRALLLWRQLPGGGNELMLVSLADDESPTPLLSGPGVGIGGRISPDGTLLALPADTSSRNELFVYSFPDMNGKWQISAGGAASFAWLADGSGLVYATPDRRLLRVRIRSRGADLTIEPAEELFRGRFPDLQAGPWALAADGTRLLAVIPLENEPAPVLTVVSNWAEELR